MLFRSLEAFEKYNIEEETGKNMEELKTISMDLIFYLKGYGGNELLESHFNNKEILHMEDVQDLFKLNRILKYLSIGIYIVILLYLSKSNEYSLIGRTFLIGPIINYGLLGLLGLLASLDFNKYFTYFHLLFFNNDLWLLDPNTDLMIQMLPESFFMGMAKKILLSFLLYMVILQVLAYPYLRKGKKEDEKTKKSNRKTKKLLHKK